MQALEDWGVHRVERQARVRQPLRESIYGGCIVVVEMAPRRKHLDRIEAMGRNVDEMFAREPRLVKQVRRDPETALSQTDRS
jgi:hypothetical protein